MLDPAVALDELADFAELNGALRAGFDAGGREPLVQTIDAGVALGHLCGLGVKLRCAVGAGLCAGSAADAFIGKDKGAGGVVHLQFSGAGTAAHTDIF